MKRHLVTLYIAAAVALTLPACGSGSGSHAALLPAIPSAQSTPQAGAARATLTIVVPLKASSIGARQPLYISQNTQSIGITIYDASHTHVLQTTNENLNPGSPGCSSTSGALTCTITIFLAPAHYSFDITTYDGALNASNNPTGSQLSANLDVPITISAGQNNVLGVTLGGLPKTVVFVPSATAALTNIGSNQYRLTGCTSTQIVNVYGVDADGNYILGTGAPTVALTSFQNDVVIAQPLGAAAPNSFSLNCLTAYSTPVSLSYSATPVAGSGGSPVTAGIALSQQLSQPIGTASSNLIERQLPAAGSVPTGIASGPDGAMWVTEQGANKILRVDTTKFLTPNPFFQEFTEYTVTTPNSQPTGIVAGPDGALWFTETAAGKIGRITTSGVITEYATPTANSNPMYIVVGSDGALYFTEAGPPVTPSNPNPAGQIGRITTGGVITEFPLPGSYSPSYIAAGGDGKLWFSGSNAASEGGSISTSGAFSPCANVQGATGGGIATDPNGYLDVGLAGVVETLTYSCSTSQTSSPGSAPGGATIGSDGNFWMADTANDFLVVGSGSSYASAPAGFAHPASIQNVAAGPDGAIWFTESSSQANSIGRFR